MCARQFYCETDDSNNHSYKHLFFLSMVFDTNLEHSSYMNPIALINVDKMAIWFSHFTHTHTHTYIYIET